MTSSIFKKLNFHKGKIIIEFDNGDKYTGDFLWEKDKKRYYFHGKGKIIMTKKFEEYEGEWKYGEFHG